MVKQKDFIDGEKLGEWKAKIYGIGSTGAQLCKQLALVGVKTIEVFDMDTVDADNIGSQEYNITHIGMKKTDAMKTFMKTAYDFDIIANFGEITKDSVILPEEKTLYFCGFDSIEARRLLWDKIKTYPILWAETRIGRDNQRFYIIDLIKRDEEVIADYERTLDPSLPRSELVCGEKGSYPCSSELIGKFIRHFIHYVEGSPYCRCHITIWGENAPVHVMVGDVPTM